MHQVGFGSEDGIDNIGCYWFYCNASQRIWTKMAFLYNRFVTCNRFSEGLKYEVVFFEKYGEDNCFASGRRRRP